MPCRARTSLNPRGVERGVVLPAPPPLPPPLFTPLDESKVSVTPVDPLFTPDTNVAEVKGVEGGDTTGRFAVTLNRSRLPNTAAPLPCCRVRHCCRQLGLRHCHAAARAAVL